MTSTTSPLTTRDRLTPKTPSDFIMLSILITLFLWIPGFFLLLIWGFEKVPIGITIVAFVPNFIPFLLTNLMGPRYLREGELLVITDRQGNYKRRTTKSGDWLIPFFESAKRYFPSDLKTIKTRPAEHIEILIRVDFDVNLSKTQFLLKFDDGIALSRYVGKFLQGKKDPLKVSENDIIEQRWTIASDIQTKLSDALRKTDLFEGIRISNVSVESIHFV